MAHNAFVHVGCLPREKEVVEFGQLVPKPDLLIMVRAPLEVALRRVQTRGHKRAGGSVVALEAMLANADRVFSCLAQVESIRDRMMMVENQTNRLEELDHRAEAIAEVVRSKNSTICK